MNIIPAKANGVEVEFIKKKSGEIHPILANVATLLRHNIYTWDLGFDEFSNRLYKGQEPLEDQHFLELTDWVQHQGIIAGQDIVASACMRVARERPFHQVREFLELLTWDQTPRLNSMLTLCAGAADAPLISAYSAKWMIQAVARIFEPGCQADATLVFEGPQGVGKSSFFRTLFGDKWFTDHLPSLDSKDALLQLRGVWCVEIAELATYTKSDAKRSNQFLTSRIDRYRDPYGRLVADYPRQNVFAGTVNPGAGGYLKDETGARRFWCVRTANEVNLVLLEETRDQLWAEAVARYRAGEVWHLNNRATQEEAAEAQAERYIGDPWQEVIEAFTNARFDVTGEDILRDCLGFQSKTDWGQRELNRIAACLSHAGWERYRKPKNSYGKRTWAYRRVLSQNEPGTAQSQEIDRDNLFTDIDQ